MTLYRRSKTSQTNFVTSFGERDNEVELKKWHQLDSWIVITARGRFDRLQYVVSGEVVMNLISGPRFRQGPKSSELENPLWDVQN